MKIDMRDLYKLADFLNGLKPGEQHVVTRSVMANLRGSVTRNPVEILMDNIIESRAGSWEIYEEMVSGDWVFRRRR